jgi:hypothetical protein
MAKQRNLFQVVAFDPGGIIGWAHFVIHKRAFINPKNNWHDYVLGWRTGEFKGTEYEQIEQAIERVHAARFGKPPFVSDTHVVSEDFDLVQTIGGKDLLSPVRINAALDYACRKFYALEVQLQSRTMRTNQTKERLHNWGFWPCKGKDSFAAMQHAVTWIRRTKLKANERPWKLTED